MKSYLADLVLLHNALSQTGWTGPIPDEATWRQVVRERLQQVRWERIVDDVRPFLEHDAGLDLLTRENLMRLLG